MPEVYKYENYTIQNYHGHYKIIAPNGLEWGSADSKNEAEKLIEEYSEDNEE